MCDNYHTARVSLQQATCHQTRGSITQPHINGFYISTLLIEISFLFHFGLSAKSFVTRSGGVDMTIANICGKYQ